jgi:hypothetical protein
MLIQYKPSHKYERNTNIYYIPNKKIHYVVFPSVTIALQSGKPQLICPSRVSENSQTGCLKTNRQPCNLTVLFCSFTTLTATIHSQYAGTHSAVLQLHNTHRHRTHAQPIEQFCLQINKTTFARF